MGEFLSYNKGGTALLYALYIYCKGRLLFERKVEEKMSKNLEKTYNPKEIESKLYEKWCEKKETIYHCNAASEYYRKAAYGTCTG